VLPDPQVDLLKAFADQAAIAIENVRLFEAEQQRTRELTESLEQQTATSEVLKVISRSTFDLQAVLETLVESAARLCDADQAMIRQQEGGVLVHGVGYGYSSEFSEYARTLPIAPGRGSAAGRALLECKIIHIPDVRADPEYTWTKAKRFGGFRTVLAVPMLREGNSIGVLTLTRSEVRPFTDKQIELVQTFADQAVIAIENVRLFEAEQQRTRELTESLERQTATSKVLEVISSSSGDLKPVFEAILANAVRLCGAKFGNLYLRDGDGFRAAAMHNAPPAYAEQRAGFLQPSPNSSLWQVMRTKQPAQIADMTKLQAYVDGDPWLIATVSLGGHRGVLSVPMLHDDEPIGAITIFRQEAGAFADKQIELLTNFAKQAVIAIENARLLNELHESLEQQTATADILRVIAGTPEDSKRALDTIAETGANVRCF
jgi:GAF domain-containing protein